MVKISNQIGYDKIYSFYPIPSELNMEAKPTPSIQIRTSVRLWSTYLILWDSKIGFGASLKNQEQRDFASSRLGI